MKTRLKQSITPTLTNRDDAETIMTLLAQNVNAQRALLTERDSLVLEVNKRFEARLATLESFIGRETTALRIWAESNPDQFPKGRKSIEMISGTLGFRTGTPKLALLSRAFNWEKVLALLSTLAAWKRLYVRTKEEVDKDAILGAYSQAADKPAFAEDIKRVGLKVTRDESFFIDPNLTDLDARQVEKAA